MESADAADAVMGDQRGITTHVHGKITSNIQIRECRLDTECIMHTKRSEGTTYY